MVLVSYKLTATIVLADLTVMLRHFLHTGQERATLRGTEDPMTTTIEFITALFCQVADQIPDIPKHPQASLWPSEVVTLEHVSHDFAPKRQGVYPEMVVSQE